MKFLIIILLLLSLNEAYSETNDINVYGTFPGYTKNFEIDMEYSLLNFNILGLESTTYLKFGASMFGFYDVFTVFSYPIIGFVQFFGEKEGLDFGANYFRSYRLDLENKNLPRDQRIPERDEFEAIGFEIGYRLYSGNSLIRITYTPIYHLSPLPWYGRDVHLVGISIGFGL